MLHVHTALIVKADQIYAEALRQVTLEVFPSATVKLATTVTEASLTFARETFDLLVTGVGASLGGDMLDFLSSCTQNAARRLRVLVVTTHREPRVLGALHNLSVHGVFDSASERRDKFIAAIKAVANGEHYWSPSFSNRPEGIASPRDPFSHLLTVCEQMVLSIIGDGCDDETAATELQLSPATISTVRRTLHRKLGVQHRGELVRLAAQNGFVRFTPSGVVRTGFNILAAAHAGRKTRQPQLVPA